MSELDVVEPTSARAKPARRPRQDDYEDFFERGGIALHLVGHDGTILHANQAELDLLGYPAGEYIGQNIVAFHANPATVLDILTRLKAGEKLTKYPAALKARDGSIRHVEITSSGRFQGKRFLNTRCFTVDVTDLHNAREEARRRDQRLKGVLDALPAAVYTTDARGKIDYFNRAAVELAGREPRIGEDEWCVTFRLFTTDGKELPHDSCPMAVALKENRPIRGVEAVAQRPDGSFFPFLPFPTPLHGSDGELLGAVNMLVDISERKQAETHQRLLLNELNHRVKNNMAMLHGLLNAAQREASSSEAALVLADASRRVGAMAAAQQVLYSEGSTRSATIVDFLHAVCESAKQVFPDDVHLKVEAGPGHIPGEISMPLSLILNELLTNAAKHGVQDEGSCDVVVSLVRKGADLILTVEDNGPGFDFTASNRRSSGTGLVGGLARQLGGTFSVERVPGARCVVRFPDPGVH